MNKIAFTIYSEPAYTRITYIYAMVGIEGDIRYIGKADNPFARFRRHLKDKNDTHKTRWIKNLAELGYSPKLKVLASVPFNDWQEHERKWIEKFKNDGCNLTNSTDGGKGPLMPNEETREKMRFAKLGNTLTQEHKAKVSAALKGRPKPKRTKEHSQALGLSNKGRVISLEHRSKLAKANMLRSPASSSGFKGVYHNKRFNRYSAYIKINRIKKHLGTFCSADAAARAFNDAAISFGWPDAGLNKV